MGALHRLLELPRVYALTQALTQMWGMLELRSLFKELVDGGSPDCVLELGCGTGRWPVSRYVRFIRTDLNDGYFPSSPPSGVEFRRIDATDLSPLGDESFDLVYSFGLYHHLADPDVVRSLQESARVVRRDGRIVVFDAILPTSPFNLVGWVLRRLDRGRWIRTEAGLRALVATARLRVTRAQTCRWGPALEGCFLELRRPGENAGDDMGARPAAGHGNDPDG